MATAARKMSARRQQEARRELEARRKQTVPEWYGREGGEVGGRRAGALRCCGARCGVVRDGRPSMRTVLCTDAGSPEADAVSWWSLARVTSRHGEHLSPTCVEQEAGSAEVSVGVSAR